MASDAPLPSEIHKVTIVLDGSKLKGSDQARFAKYQRYMDRIRKLVEPQGATVQKPQLFLKQSTITRRKNKRKAAAKKKGRTSRRRGR